MGYFRSWVRVQKLFWCLLILNNDFCFMSFPLFLLYHVVLSLWGWVVMGGCGVGGLGVPIDYAVSTQQQLWLCLLLGLCLL